MPAQGKACTHRIVIMCQEAYETNLEGTLHCDNSIPEESCVDHYMIFVKPTSVSDIDIILTIDAK